MIVKKTVQIEAWCDNCKQGMLQPLLDLGYYFKKPVEEFIDSEIECPNCKHKNTFTDAFIIIPTAFMFGSVKNVEKGMGIMKGTGFADHLES